MSAGSTIIKDALQAIGAHSVVSPAAQESITLGMRRLNSMLALWKKEGVDIGYTELTVPGDELGEPTDTTNAIVANLAIVLAPDFDNGKQNVSPTLEGRAASGKADIFQIYRTISIPDKVVSSTLPRGAGNTICGGPIFKGKGGTVNG